jgi:hypothetical protein
VPGGKSLLSNCDSFSLAWLVALSPYSMDLDITSVPKTNSGKSELEVNTANLSGS